MGQLFHFRGYDIPVNLVEKTGGGPDRFGEVSDWHIAQVQRYIGIRSADYVLEIGCGIGRDAIPLTKLFKEGKYTGTDTIKQSIEWCTDNITIRYPDFIFIHHDIHDTLHNTEGKLHATDISLPAQDETIDLIILHSVFTHMFADEIVHYFNEFNRVLKPTGRIWASFFIVNQDLLTAIRGNPEPEGPHTGWNLSFLHSHGAGCFINVEKQPRQSVAYEESTLMEMIEQGGLILDQVLWGAWSGSRENPRSGQDVVVLKKYS